MCRPLFLKSANMESTPLWDALKACRLLFQLAKQKYGMDSLIITCNPDNLPSRRTLEALGGELKAIVDVPKEHYLYQYGDVQKCIFEYHL